MTYSLFIGRWQPLHEGHRKLIQTVIDEGKQVCIGIRDTEISQNNPYTIEQRREMISVAFPEAKIVVVPDIEEIVYGRDVGYRIRELRLPPEIEVVSGTNIRDNLDNR